MKTNRLIFLFPFFLMVHASPSQAQEITGTPGLPSATTTVDGNYLPNPPDRFGGVINLSAKDSKPYWPPNVVPPKDAPNVLLILTDDQGFGIYDTFGGIIPTPNMDRIAKTGLRYTQFHSTALCSPSRAAIITGRNHHSVGFGVIAEQATGFPGYDSTIGTDNATIGRILQENGYATSWFGKNHNTPDYQYSVAGPFDQWPSGMGFEYFYGFMGGETDQWTPWLFRDHTQIFPWREQPGYNLVTGMADDAIRYLHQLEAAAPEKPFFLYYAPGATHAPHQPTQEWIDKMKGKFDMGWNELRKQIFANQKRLGVIPADTVLTDWPDGQAEFGGAKLPKWDTLTDTEKKLFARQAEVFAAYVAYTDHEIGRVIQTVEDLGKLDNTLIIYVSGDNGTSAEGSTIGTPFDMAAIQGINIPVEDQMKYYDKWGGPETTPHMSVAWSWAFDTPFKWTKQVASHFGGTRQGMVMSWPGHIKDAGGIRPQFHHFIDVVPTILEATGVKAPKMVDGIAQKPIEGISMAYTWDKANAKVPSKRTTQYFEMFGNRAIYHEGWIATTTPPNAPWFMGEGKFPDVVNGYNWELYHIDEDFSESNDLAAKYPEKLRELQELFLVEAAKYQVLPLDNSILPRILAARPSYTAGRNEFVYTTELSGLPNGDAPNILAKSYSITADVEVPEGGGDGMIVTCGGRFGGYGLYLLKGKPVYVYNFLGINDYRWAGEQTLTPGKHTIMFDFKYDGPGMAKGGSGKLYVDGKEVFGGTIPHSIPAILTIDESFDIGMDTRTGVNDKDYQLPFRFNGKIDKVVVKLGPSQMVAADKKAANEMKKNADN
ncbi:Arylsulfatase [Novipirellula aureliae]|uniref:Arylsulfatase n=1 Tax=Novipirellula aureliae TaxID=2527966 RepID=A0A5C6DBH6_9BACT|nr:arylsulfatase [Novipirellula aureliae]TWU34533.1 Arylsulfatase [Novipirellula aureliae]